MAAPAERRWRGDGGRSRRRLRRLGGSDLVGFWKLREEIAVFLRLDLSPCRGHEAYKRELKPVSAI